MATESLWSQKVRSRSDFLEFLSKNTLTIHTIDICNYGSYATPQPHF